jgi:hypothetical protein
VKKWVAAVFTLYFKGMMQVINESVENGHEGCSQWKGVTFHGVQMPSDWRETGSVVASGQRSRRHMTMMRHVCKCSDHVLETKQSNFGFYSLPNLNSNVTLKERSRAVLEGHIQLSCTACAVLTQVTRSRNLFPRTVKLKHARGDTNVGVEMLDCNDKVLKIV